MTHVPAIGSRIRFGRYYGYILAIEHSITVWRAHGSGGQLRQVSIPLLHPLYVVRVGKATDAPLPEGHRFRPTPVKVIKRTVRLFADEFIVL